MKQIPGTATTIFLLFFGIALLDALTGGRISVALFWIAVGAVFAYDDVRYIRRRRAGR